MHYKYTALFKQIYMQNRTSFFKNGIFNSIFKDKNTQPSCSFAASPIGVYSFISTVMTDIAGFFQQKPSAPREEAPQGQMIVLQKLAKYLRLTAPNTTVELQQILDGGHCSGLSICHALMDLSSKVRWWEACLLAIALWDGTLESLDNKIILPDSESKDPIILRTLFDRALNYIVTHHSGLPGFKRDDINSDTQLHSEKKQMEIFKNNKVEVIKTHTEIAGFFSTKKLLKLLDKDYIKNSLCIITGPHHTIRIGYRDRNWILYDPNYAHNKTLPLYATLSKMELVKEIIHILGNSLAIRIAHFQVAEEKDMPRHWFNQYLEQDIENLLQEYGLHMIARYAKKYLPSIIERASSDAKCARAVLAALKHSPPQTFDNGKYITVVEPLIYYIAEDFPDQIDKIFRMVKAARNSDEVLATIFKDLTHYEESHLTTLHLINSKSMGIILDYVSQCKSGVGSSRVDLQACKLEYSIVSPK